MAASTGNNAIFPLAELTPAEQLIIYSVMISTNQNRIAKFVQ